LPVKPEILVNVGVSETRVALVEQGVLQEIFIERPDERTLVGRIYKGRVQRVLPGMQAAFVDIGLARTGFLHVDDIEQTTTETQTDIRRLLSAGDDVIVQVVKDPIGSKGARLTTALSLPSRFLVYLPRGDNIGVSTRLADEAERERLRSLVQQHRQNGGYIVRTAAEGAAAEMLAADITYLQRCWDGLAARMPAATPGELLHTEPSLGVRVLRDECTYGASSVRVDDAQEFARLRDFARDFMPAVEAAIELHDDARPLFALHQIEEEIARALERQAPLRSGGYLVIDQTEAMTTIDVNTGGFTGHKDLEDTIYRTNIEAAVAVARQVRLRNLGGIIIVDFIDMADEVHRRNVLDALSTAMAGDRARCRVTGLSPLGLVEISRRRTHESLQHLLCDPCPICEGRGFVRSVATVCQDIFRELLRQGRQGRQNGSELVILAHRDVLDRLLQEDAAVLKQIETRIGRPIRLQAEALYAPDQFDLVTN
jgi:ribonuclease G